MSNTSCTEFSRLLEERVEAHLSLDTPELRSHADQCADCRLAWLDALLVDGAVAQWRMAAKKTPPLVELADAVLYRKATGDESAIRTEDLSPTIPFAAVQRATSAVEVEHRLGVQAPARVADSARSQRSERFRTAFFVAMGLAAAVCGAFLLARPVRHRDAGTLVKQTPAPSPSPISAPKREMQVALNAPNVSAPGTAAPATRIADPGAEAADDDFERAPLNFASQAADSPTAASVSVPRSGRSTAAVAPAGDDDRWVDDVGRQFEPIGNNLSHAFHFLWEAVPAEKAPAT
jgi:hypothetical protein